MILRGIAAAFHRRAGFNSPAASQQAPALEEIKDGGSRPALQRTAT